MKLARFIWSTPVVFGITGCLMFGCGVGTFGPMDREAVSEELTRAIDARETLGAALDAKDPLGAPVQPQEGSGQNGGQQLSPWATPQPFGTWILDDGVLLPEFDSVMQVTAIQLEAGGFGRLFMRDLFTDANDCIRIFHLFDGETLALDLSREPGLAFNPERTMFFPVVVIGHNSLGLADETGQIALFSRHWGDLPDDIRCKDLNIVDRIEGIPAPNSFGDLVLHFGDLIYNSQDDLIERFDLATDTIGAPLGPTQSRFMQAKQGLDFWTHCGCGGSPDAFRRTLVSVVDTVHTGIDLDLQITIRAAEYLPTTDRLWLHGFARDDNRARFLVVNTNGEPDVLEEVFNFNRSLRGLSFDGQSLWGIVTMASRSIVRIDPETGRTVETFELPEEDTFWTGLEIVDGFLYLIGSEIVDGEVRGVLLRLTR